MNLEIPAIINKMRNDKIEAINQNKKMLQIVKELKQENISLKNDLYHTKQVNKANLRALNALISKLGTYELYMRCNEIE